MIVRPERVSDYPAIADVHLRAFDHRVTEPVIVTLLRQRAGFDPELSLLAEQDGRIVGHVLFFPYTIRLLDSDVRAVNLAPIAVLPEWQRRGVGGLLVEEGHRLAAAGGYEVSFLLGHASYYPRFGYRTGAYGSAQAAVSVEGLPREPLEERAPLPQDVPALRDLWRRDEAQVDFSIDPGPDLMEWLSPNPAIESAVFLLGNEVAGYVRRHRSEPTSPRVFLARDAASARAVAGSLALRAGNDATELVLPVHPTSASARAFPDASGTAWNAAMARPLNGNLLDRYFAKLKSGERPPGRVTWPVAFDL